MRIAVLGGGGFRVPLVHRALVASNLSIDEIVLQDVDEQRLAVIAAVLSDARVRVETDLGAAVDGADLIFSAVRVGGLDGRVTDERAALDLGVLGQETVGAGGLCYALRAVPQAHETAQVIAQRAPDAWTITMTNPAGVITETMGRMLGRRVIGVCDSPTGLVRHACAALDVAGGDVRVDYLGLNHLGWLRALVVDGVDLLPELIANPELLQQIEEGRLFGADLIAALGALPNEYLYWYYGAREALAAVQAAARTRGEHVRAEQSAFYAAAAADPSHARELWEHANEERNRSYFAELRTGARDESDVAATGYAAVAVALAEAVTTDVPATLIVDVPNGDTVAGFPSDAVIEVPCAVDGNGATPLPVAPPDLHQLGLMAQVKDCERAIIEAALTGSAPAALHAFALHPLVGSLTAAHALTSAWQAKA